MMNRDDEELLAVSAAGIRAPAARFIGGGGGCANHSQATHQLVQYQLLKTLLKGIVSRGSYICVSVTFSL